KHRLDMVRREGEEKTVARKGLKPALERNARRRLDGVKIQRERHAGPFTRHGGRARNSALADILGGASKTLFGEFREKREIGAKALGRRLERRLEIVEGLRVRPPAV